MSGIQVGGKKGKVASVISLQHEKVVVAFMKEGGGTLPQKGNPGHEENYKGGVITDGRCVPNSPEGGIDFWEKKWPAESPSQKGIKGEKKSLLNS